MNVTKCDYCGTETQSTVDWLQLRREWPDNDPEKGIMFLGKQGLDFCSQKCVINYLLPKNEAE